MRFALLGETYKPEVGDSPVTGYSVATDDLTKALLRWSRAEEIQCICRPGTLQEQKLKEAVRNLPGYRERERVRFVNELDLLFYGADHMPETGVLHSVKEEFQSLLTLREMLGRPVPVTFTLHGIAEQHLITDMFLPMLTWPFKPYDAVFCPTNSVYRTVDTILDRLSEQLSITLGTKVQRKIQLKKVPLGIDTDRFRPMDKRAARSRLEIPQNAFVILWFGRFSDLFKADLHPLLLVYRNLLRDNPDQDLLLILAGSEDYTRYTDLLKRDLHKMGIDERVRILFHKNIPNRAELYSAADVFTSPIDNLQETFGLTPIEAMACGIPQVVSDWDGYKDTVQDGITGFRIPVYWTDCLSDLAAADCFPLDRNLRRMLYQYLSVRSTALDCRIYQKRLQRLIDDPVLRASMAAASRNRAVRYYDLRNTVSRAEKVWSDLIKIADDDQSTFGRMPMINYCHDFSAYPTKVLDDRTSFVLSETGWESNPDDLPGHRSFHDSIDEASLVRQIYDQVRSLPGGTSVTIEQITAQNSGWTQDQCGRGIMYLLKNGILEIEEEN